MDTLVEAVFKGGIVVGLATFALYYRLFQTNAIMREGSLRKIRHEAKAKIKENKKEKNGSALERRWMRFGGGYYGVVVLITLIIVEVKDSYAFLSDFEVIKSFYSNFSFNSIVAILVNQLQNLISAVVWPSYWIKYITGNAILIWFVVTYAAYYVGLHFAREISKPTKVDGS